MRDPSTLPRRTAADDAPDSDAFTSLCRLRHSKLQAARDLFYIDALIKEEELLHTGKNRFVEMFSIGRNRRAALASGIVMFMQVGADLSSLQFLKSDAANPLEAILWHQRDRLLLVNDLHRVGVHHDPGVRRLVRIRNAQFYLLRSW